MAFFKRKNKDKEISKTEVPLVRLLSYQIGNLQGIGKRNRQEDSFSFANAFNVVLIKEEGLLFTVCDGMGGMKDGKIASETAIASIRADFKAYDRSENLAFQLKESAYTASSAVESALGGYGGSTLVAGILYDEKLNYVSVGDSGLYLKRGSGIYKINSTHNLCNELYSKKLEEGKLDVMECRNADEAMALTSFLGMQGMKLVDSNVFPIPIKDGDVILACSDGVSGVLSEEELLYSLSKGSSEECCRSIEQYIINHDETNQDNYTAVVIRCLY